MGKRLRLPPPSRPLRGLEADRGPGEAGAESEALVFHERASWMSNGWCSPASSNGIISTWAAPTAKEPAAAPARAAVRVPQAPRVLQALRAPPAAAKPDRPGSALRALPDPSG